MVISGCGSGIRCFFDLWIRDLGWVKSQDPDPGCTTRIRFPRHYKPFFGVKILKFFDADPGSATLGRIPMRIGIVLMTIRIIKENSALDKDRHQNVVDPRYWWWNRSDYNFSELY
jgi:hypothetical protein